MVIAAHPSDTFKAQRQPAMPMCTVTDPAGWTRADLTKGTGWLYGLSEPEKEEICAAVAPLNVPGIDVMHVGRAHFSLPNFSQRLAQIREQLSYGQGLAMIRGLPIDDLGKRGTSIAFWGISQHLGDGVWSQNKHGHVLGHVTDLGQSKSNPSQRGPYSSEGIPFHCDCADLVGLLCLETSVTGGESTIASAVTVYNVLLDRRPDLAKVLCEPYFRDRRDEVPAGMKPWYELAVFHFHQDYFSASIEPTYMGSAHRFDEVPEMTPLQREALDVVQKIAAEQSLEMGFQRGDMQFLNNHVIFHSRNGFTDAAEPEKKRHLLRIWLKLHDGRPLPAAFYARHGKPGEIDRPGGIVGPDTLLNAPLMRT